MEVLCFCCLVGAIIYTFFIRKSVAYDNRTRNINQNQNIANVPVSQQVDSLTNTMAFTQETGQVIYYANDRHNNADREYRFKYRLVGEGWRAYVLRTPNINNRTKGTHVHMLRDNQSYYICWDRTVNSIHDIQTISKRWADNFQEYLSTGRTF